MVKDSYLSMGLHGSVGQVLVQHLLLHQQHPLLLVAQVGRLSWDGPLGVARAGSLAATTHVGRHHGVLYLAVASHGWSHPLAQMVYTTSASATATEVAQRFGIVVGQHGGRLLLLLLLGQGVGVDATWWWWLLLLLPHHAHVVVREVVVHWGFGPIVGCHARH